MAHKELNQLIKDNIPNMRQEIEDKIESLVAQFILFLKELFCIICSTLKAEQIMQLFSKIFKLRRQNIVQINHIEVLINDHDNVKSRANEPEK